MVGSDRIQVGCRVEGSHGPLIEDPTGIKKRRVKEKVVGTVVGALDLHKWEVVFDYDGEIRVVTSRSLQIVDDGVGIPLDEETTDDDKVAMLR